MDRVKFIIFSGREKLALIIVVRGWERVKLSSLIFAGRKRVRIDALFRRERVNNIISFTIYVQIIHKRTFTGREKVKFNFNFGQGANEFKLSSISKKGVKVNFCWGRRD